MSTDGTKPPSFTPQGTGPQRTSVRTKDQPDQPLDDARDGSPTTGEVPVVRDTTADEQTTSVEAGGTDEVRGARPSPVVPGRRDNPTGGTAGRPQRSSVRPPVERPATAREDLDARDADRAAERAERPEPAAVGPRRVRLALARIDPWSVMKLAFLLSFAVGIMIVVATAVVWTTLDSMAVFTQVNQTIAEVTGSETFFDLEEYVAFDRVISLATIIAIVDVVLLTALATLMAFLYNIVAALVGGIHVTLTDD